MYLTIFYFVKKYINHINKYIILMKITIYNENNKVDTSISWTSISVNNKQSQVLSSC